MQKLSIYSLGVQEVVRAHLFPVCDRCQILESLLFEEMDPARAQVPVKTQVWDFFPEGDGLGGFPSDTEKR